MVFVPLRLCCLRLCLLLCLPHFPSLSWAGQHARTGRADGDICSGAARFPPDIPCGHQPGPALVSGKPVCRSAVLHHSVSGACLLKGMGIGRNVAQQAIELASRSAAKALTSHQLSPARLGPCPSNPWLGRRFPRPGRCLPCRCACRRGTQGSRRPATCPCLASVPTSAQAFVKCFCCRQLA